DDVSISIESDPREPGGRMPSQVTLCSMGVCGNLNALNLIVTFANALMEQGFRSDLFLAKDRLFFYNLQRHCPILCAAGYGGILNNWVLFSKPLVGDPVRRDSPRFQRSLHALRSGLSEFEISFRPVRTVGTMGNLDTDTRAS